MNELPIKGQAAFLNRFDMTEEELEKDWATPCLQCGRSYGSHIGAISIRSGGRVLPEDAECICPED